MVRKSLSRFVRLWGLLALMVALLAVRPQVAWARSMDVINVDIDATVAADGSVSVIEQRTYDVMGSYNGLYWDVPEGSYEGHDIRASISWVGVVAEGEQTLLKEGYQEEPGTYQISDEGDYLHLTIFWPTNDETVTFQVSYTLKGLALRWADVGELYWQYVPADAEAQGEWLNVSCRVHLPVPDGTVVKAGEDVRAWGHGPIDGDVGIDGDTVRYFSPGVGSAEFLEARVAFPSEWLGDVQASSESRLDTILAEEDAWAKEANAQRTKARLIVYGFPAFMCVAGIGGAVTSFMHKKRRVAKGPKPRFTDTYFRDVPTNDHPAVLGMLYRTGRSDVADFSATLMRLADKGRIVLDAVWTEREGKHGKTKRVREWRLTRRESVGSRAQDTRAGGKAIDDAAMSFVFDVVGDKHKHVYDSALLSSSGEPYVLMSFFDETAETWPEAYQRGYNGWSEAVRSAYLKRKFEEDTEDDLLNSVLGLGSFALSVIFALAGMFLGVPNLPLCIGFIVWFGAGIFIVLTDEDMPKITYTQEGVDIRAQLEALKRWLEDFTRLEEAIPTDVVLWNRLLVMATVFGIADKVVKQLKVYAPELVKDPAFGAYSWYASDMDDALAVPAASIGHAISSARSISASKLYHEVSTEDTAHSSYSSLDGSGGGFSSGGGGGFSGGGGRGGGF